MEEIIVPLALFTLIGFLYSQMRRRAELGMQRRYDLGLRTIERFADSEALDRFLNSPAGHDFFRLIENHNAPIAQRLMRTMQLGLIVGFLGIAFCLLSVAIVPHMVIPGAILSGLGAALLIGTAVSARMVKHWKLIDPPRPQQRDSSPYREVLE